MAAGGGTAKLGFANRDREAVAKRELELELGVQFQRFRSERDTKTELRQGDEWGN